MLFGVDRVEHHPNSESLVVVQENSCAIVEIPTPRWVGWVILILED